MVGGRDEGNPKPLKDLQIIENKQCLGSTGGGAAVSVDTL